MKILISFFYALFIMPYSMNGQLEWEVLEPHVGAHVKLAYHNSKTNELIGSIAITTVPGGSIINQTVVSKDKGINWEYLPNVLNDGRFVRPLPNGDYLIGSKEAILKYENGTIDTLTSLEEQVSILYDLQVLPNGNIIVAGDQLIQLYDEDGNFKKSIERRIGDFYISEDEDVHYMVFSHDLMVFNSAFTDVSDNGEYKIPSFTNSFFVRNNRYFIDGYYSDNLLNWNPFIADGKDISSPNWGNALALNQTNRLYYSKFDTIYTSEDFGESFTILDEEYQIKELQSDGGHTISNILALDNNEIIIYFNDDDFDSPQRKTIYYSENGQGNWQERAIALAYPDARSLTVATSSNIFIETKEGDYRISSTQEGWQQHLDGKNIISYNDGTLIKYDSNGLYKSTNEGETYSFLEQEIASYHVQNENLFRFPIIDFWPEVNGNVSISEDKGETFSELYSISYFWNILVTPYFTSNGTTFRTDYLSPSPADDSYRFIVDKHFDGGREIVFDRYSFKYQNHMFLNNSGAKIFIVEDYDLMVSLDEAETFEPVSNIKEVLEATGLYRKYFSDRNDNLYCFGKKSVYMSEDSGTSWKNISPTNSNLIAIHDIDDGTGHCLYLATTGTPILKLCGYGTSLEQMSSEENILKILIYPNPANKLIRLEPKSPFNPISYSIFSANGIKILYGKLNENYSIDISGLESGVHVLNLFDKGGLQHSEKFSVQ